MMQKQFRQTYKRGMNHASYFRAFAVLILVTLSVPFKGQAHDKAAHDQMGRLVVALPNGLTVESPMVLVAGPAAKSAAAFMLIGNSSDIDDRLIAVEADFAGNLQLHTHIMENDIAKMREVEGGFKVEGGSSHELVRGGDHIMIMGLKSVPAIGETVNLTLFFENAGTFTIPFKVMQAGAMQHEQK